MIQNSCIGRLAILEQVHIAVECVSMCSLTNCTCDEEWLDIGWTCPVMWARRLDLQIQTSNKLKFRRLSRIWSGRHGEAGSRLLAGHGWHKGKTYEILAIHRTVVFTQVLVYDHEIGTGWVNVWRIYRTGNVAVWANKVDE